MTTPEEEGLACFTCQGRGWIAVSGGFFRCFRCNPPRRIGL